MKRTNLFLALLGIITLAPSIASCGTKSYEITFKDYDGSILETLTVNEGQVPAYSKDNPTREKDAKFTYLFSGWDKQLVAANGNETYTATYSETLNEYTVTFKNGEQVLYSNTYKFGEIPNYNGDTPTKDGNVQYTYEFDGWDKNIEPVSADTIYNAKFSQEYVLYNVSWEDRFFDFVDTETYKYGEIPTFKKEIEESYEDETSYYTFSGWTPEVGPVENHVIYHATYEQEYKTFDVTFLNEDGSTLFASSYEYGTTPICNDVISQYEKDGKTYLFNGWDKQVVPVTQNATYKAVYIVAPWSILDDSYSKYKTLDVLSTTVDSECSVWTSSDFACRDNINGWKGGTFDCSWRTIVIVDANGQVLYAVQNPANGYGGPSGTGYYRAEAYETDYSSNPAFTILEGYGKWTADNPTASNQYLLNVPEGGFIVTAYNGKEATLADNLVDLISGGSMTTSTKDLNQSHSSRTWYDVRIFFDPSTNTLISFTKDE